MADAIDVQERTSQRRSRWDVPEPEDTLLLIKREAKEVLQRKLKELQRKLQELQRKLQEHQR